MYTYFLKAVRLYKSIDSYSIWQLRKLKYLAEKTVEVTSNDADAPSGQCVDVGTWIRLEPLCFNCTVR